MTRNMGRTDRILRAAVAAPLLLVVAWLAGVGTALGVVALVLAAVMLATAAVGWCPLYVPLGLDTCGAGPDAAA